MRAMREIKTHGVMRRFTAVLLCLCMITAMISDAGISRASAAGGTSGGANGGTSGTSGVTRQADPSTMDKYKEMLDFSTNTRYAGRLWSDKTVFALGDNTNDQDDDWDGSTLHLTMADDGVSGEIKLNEDFLHIFSAIGSSQSSMATTPINLVIVIDNSGSMYSNDLNGDALKQLKWSDTRIYKTLDAVNRAIDNVMEKGAQNQAAVVVFGDGGRNDSASTIMPMNHYKAMAGDGYNQYLTAGWSSKAINETNNPGDKNEKGDSGGHIIVNTQLVTGGASTQCHNGTTNIHAGIYQGMQELMNAGTTWTTPDGQKVDRIPVLVVLTDGQTTDALKIASNGGSWANPMGTLGDNGNIKGLTEGKAAGFVNGFNNKLTSFTGGYESKSSSGTNSFTPTWNGFVKSYTGGDDVPFKYQMYLPFDADVSKLKGEDTPDSEPELIYYNNVGRVTDNNRDQIRAMFPGIPDEYLKQKNKTWPLSKGIEQLKDLSKYFTQTEEYMILNTLLTAAYYKTAVDKRYGTEEDKTFQIYTISVDMPDTNNQIDAKTSDTTVRGEHSDENGMISTNGVMMNPEDCLKEGWLTNSNYIKDGTIVYPVNTVAHDYVTAIQNTITDINKLLTGNGQSVTLKYVPVSSGTALEVEIDGTTYKTDDYTKETFDALETKPLKCTDIHDYRGLIIRGAANPTKSSYWIVGDTQTYTLEPLTEGVSPKNPYGLTGEEVYANINYPTKALYASSGESAASTIAEVFDEIVREINVPMFSPVGGTNDLGVDDAVTYTDPIGKYMDVKDVTKLALFGELYDIVKTAVYDYQWNYTYMHRAGNEGHRDDPLPEGWYRGDAASATFQQKLEGTGYTNAKDAWNAGWVYRLNYKTAAQFVPTLENIKEEENPSDTVARQRNTVYTFYRIDETEKERQALHMNPAYLNGRTEKEALEGITYDKDGGHLSTPGVYALSDLRIWVEDSGDYNPEMGDTLTDTGFDEALWVNIPVNMLPLRRITISVGNGEEGQYTYSTNIPTDPSTVQAGSAESASFPLRVFYTVGISDEVLENNRVNIAGKISPEYIQENKITDANGEKARGLSQGNLEFFSNWYNPLNRYGDYATTGTDYTFGDPVVSFSPSTDNRYYAFEKALPLYNAAYMYINGEWKKVEIGDTADKANGQFTATGFDGKLIAQDLDGTAGQISSTLTGKSITPTEGDIVLLKSDRLTDVKVENGNDPFPSDGYYFLAIEFYELGENATATPTQYVITRRGSEFGSGYGSAGIKNGDMLCWHDMNGKTEDEPYVSYTEDGDSTRGNPSTKYPDGDWVLCAKPGGLRVGDLAQAVQAKGGDYSTSDEQTTIKSYYNARYSTVEEAQSLTWGFYANNVTRTANNYYLPTISTASKLGEENDIIVNVYLGNNGRLYVEDTTLLVTKLIELPKDMQSQLEAERSREFNFQVFISGMTGTLNAAVVRYNENTGSWQRQFHYIDLELDGQLFLQAQDGQKAMVDKDGKRLIPNPNSEAGGYVYADGGNQYMGAGPFYVYIGTNRKTLESVGTTNTSFRVYHNNDVDGNGTVDVQDVVIDGESGKAGTLKAATVWLVSLSRYTSDWQEKSLNPVGTEGFNIEGHYDSTLTNFELLTIDPNISDTTEITISTPYRTASAYWSMSIDLGKNANTDGDGKEKGNQTLTEVDLYDKIIPKADRPDLFTDKVAETKVDFDNTYIAAHTAEFTLKHGYGLLFSGIPSNSVYRVTEKLTKEQMEKGYTLKEVSHNQQVGSVSTYRPGVQSIPVYYHEGTTYGDIYPEEVKNTAQSAPSGYWDSKTQYGLTWAVKQNGDKNEADYLHYEPFFNTNAVVWEAYSTADKTAGGDNHHQPDDVTDGTSVFWLWNRDTNLNRNEGGSHTVLDNPSCKPLAKGGCDEEIDGGQVRHYFFKDGALRDAHYYGEGSGYLRDFARFVTSPTVHFAVEGEVQKENKDPAENEFSSSVAYTGVYSVYGNTGTYEESANFVNTIKRDKTETEINGEDVTPDSDHPNTYPGVLEGDEITYKIYWDNDLSADARIVIIDQLDEGVDYVSVTDGARYFKDRDEANKYLAEIYGDPKKPVTVDSGHVVIWDLGVKSKDASGSVELTVKVNGEAEEWWDYDGDGVADKPMGEEPEDDYMVRNRATVRVADNAYTTNTTRNPVGEPEKKETEIERATNSSKQTAPDGGSLTEPREGDPETEDGPLVYVGDTITYEITWRNYQNENAAVTVQDLLDPNVEFVSASFDPADTAWNDAEKKDALPTTGAESTTLEANGKNESDNRVTVGSDSLPVIKYDPNTRTVTWNLGEQTAMTNGKVTVKVKVLPSAAVPGQVENTARVQVGSGPWQDTHTLVNPTPEVDKDETAINGGKVEPQSSDGDRTLYPEVKVGDTVSYEIDWKAKKEKRELNSIVVTDPLDPGVDFVSASYTFKTASGDSVTVTLTDPTKTATSTQTVTEGEHADQPMVTIKFDDATHTVTWTLYGDAVVSEGHVDLTVRVTRRAVEDKDSKTNLADPKDGENSIGDPEDWEYRDGNGLESEGQLVQNRGAVKFNNDAFLTTDLVENPLTPDKTEVSPGSGELVGVGDRIDYSISYQNYTGEQADVIVRDPLDVGVDFLSATLDGATVTAAQATANWETLTEEQQK